MGKCLYIAEKPSVAMEFGKALDEQMARRDGYQESDHAVITWCVGHLVTMSYPEVYDEKYKRWSLETLPFIPDTFLYEVIPAVKKQFAIVQGLLNRPDIDTIYVCTDSGREGEYIYRLVAQMAGVKPDRDQRRVWIDSQTKEEILRGIREAKPLAAYDHLSDAAYLRAKEDYLMGINFSRLLTLKYGNSISSFLGERRTVISVGRVMTCVLGMVVRREREIRAFEKKPFYRVLAGVYPPGMDSDTGDAALLEGEFRAVEGSKYYQSPLLYKENGFKKREDAENLVRQLTAVLHDPASPHPGMAKVLLAERKTEKKNPPLLYNLAELQNDCSRRFKISPDQTLSIVQELYEKKLVTYPRTDARVLSTAVAKQIRRNIQGLVRFAPGADFAKEILEKEAYHGIEKTRYVNDKQITDHYAIIPTGQGLAACGGLSRTASGVYEMIVRRFLAIFYPPAQYKKLSLVFSIDEERFFGGARALIAEGYLTVMNASKKGGPSGAAGGGAAPGDREGEASSKNQEEGSVSPALLDAFEKVRKGSWIPAGNIVIRDGETSPPKRYNSGSMILAMENAGQLIEDEVLREQIKGSGIGTSATRAEILKKLTANKYLALNKKSQILTPTLLGEMIYDVVDNSIRSLLSAELTASWEKGLSGVADGSISSEEYMDKLTGFVRRRTQAVLNVNNQAALGNCYRAASAWYKTAPRESRKAAGSAGRGRPRADKEEKAE